MQERPPYAPSPPPPPPPPAGGWPPPPYGHYPPPPPPPPPQQTNMFALLSLISAVAGLLPFIPVIGSILGIIFGVIGRNELRNRPDQKGAELATWGIILGTVGVVLWLLFILLVAMFSAVFGHFFDERWWWYGWR